MLPSSSNPTWEIYKDYLRREVHQLIAWGYEASCPLLNSSLEEEVITEYIAEAIQEILDDFNAPEFVDYYSIKEENPVKEEGKTGKRRRRTDILIEHHKQGLRPRPCYIFEAKRLCKSNHLMDKYCGFNGLERFIDGRYASSFPEVSMLGYVQSDTIEYWAKELSNIFDISTNLSIQVSLKKIEVLDSLPNEWVSIHLRANNSLIQVFHILLDCTDA